MIINEYNTYGVTLMIKDKNQWESGRKSKYPKFKQNTRENRMIFGTAKLQTIKLLEEDDNVYYMQIYEKN